MEKFTQGQEVLVPVGEETMPGFVLCYYQNDAKLRVQLRDVDNSQFIGDDEFTVDSERVVACDLGLGDLAGEYEIVDACNGLYVYHKSGHGQGAGDGSETTLADLAAFAREDPAGFAECYGPREVDN